MKNFIILVICLFFICFITLLSRTPTLNRITHLIPLWSYISHGHWQQIILNIALFIPLGYFLQSLTKRGGAILLSMFFSVVVEVVQFITYRGMLDVDDLLSNLLGTIIGILIWRVVEKRNNGRKITEITLLFAGLVGCIMAAVPMAKSNISTRITQQFWFAVSSESTVTDGNNADKMILDGQCYTYDRATPGYTILLGNTPLDTTIDGENFSAVFPLPKKKTELLIRFCGYQPMSTGIWIRPDGSFNYVEEDVVSLGGVPKTAVLKAYCADYDTIVYEDGNRLLWLIGWENLDRNTEVIYHIHTDEPDKLPKNRMPYKFDNRGFRAKIDESATNELESLGRYRVFEKEMPIEYNITSIVVGFNTEGTITWMASFRPNYAQNQRTEKSREVDTLKPKPALFSNKPCRLPRLGEYGYEQKEDN